MTIVLTPLEIDNSDPTELILRIPNAQGGILDLRNEMQRRNPGNGPQAPGWALAIVSEGLQPIGSIKIGDDFESPIRTSLKTTVKRELALGESIIANTVRGLIEELIVDHADPIGVDRWAMPSPTGEGFEIYLGSQIIVRRRFNISSDPLRDAVLIREQRDYRRARELTLSGVNPPDFHRRYLQFLKDAYRTEDHEQFIPSDLPRETPIPRATVIRDSFVEGIDTILSAHTPTPVNWGVWQKIAAGGELTVIAATDDITADASAVHYRANSSLDTKAHYCEMDTTEGTGGTARRWGVITRYKETGIAASDNDHYQLRWEGNDILFIFRDDNGISTTLASLVVPRVGTQLLRLESSSLDAHRGLVDGVEVIGPVTDATYTFLRTGIYGRFNGVAGSGQANNWEAADIVPPPPPPPPSEPHPEYGQARAAIGDPSVYGATIVRS